MTLLPKSIFVSGILTCAMSLILIGCNNTSKDHSVKTIDQSNVGKAKEASLEASHTDYSNPAIFLGSDFGSFMRSLYGIGDYAQIVQFTANDIRTRYGDEQLAKYYRQLDLRMEMRLLSITETDSLLYMNYECLDKATKTVRRLPVILENDTVKVFPFSITEGTIFELN